MTDRQASGYQDQTATWLGWAIFVAFLLLLDNIIQLPRTAIEQRAPLQLMHDSLGLVLGLLAWARLYWFARGPAPTKPAALPEDSFAFGRAILFILILTFALEFLIGMGYAWGEARQVNFFGHQLPQLLESSDSLRKSSGYPHSALAFYYLMLISLWMAVGIYQNIRYKTGLRRLFPGTQV